MTSVWLPNFAQNLTYVEILSELQLMLIPAVGFTLATFVVGIMGNMLVLIIYGFRMKRHSSHNFILILACIDLFSCFAILTDFTSMLFPLLINTVALCKIHKTSVYVTVFISIYTLIAIAFERHRKICYPLLTQVTRERQKRRLAAVLTVGVLQACPTVVLTGQNNIPTGEKNISYSTCGIDSTYEGSIWPTLLYGIFFVVFIVDMTVLMVLYVRIWRKVRGHVSFIHSTQMFILQDQTPIIYNKMAVHQCQRLQGHQRSLE